MTTVGTAQAGTGAANTLLPASAGAAVTAGIIGTGATPARIITALTPTCLMPMCLTPVCLTPVCLTGAAVAVLPTAAAVAVLPMAAAVAVLPTAAAVAVLPMAAAVAVLLTAAAVLHTAAAVADTAAINLTSGLKQTSSHWRNRSSTIVLDEHSRGLPPAATPCVIAARMFFLRTIPAQSNLTKSRTVQSEKMRLHPRDAYNPTTEIMPCRSEPSCSSFW